MTFSSQVSRVVGLEEEDRDKGLMGRSQLSLMEMNLEVVLNQTREEEREERDYEI